MNPKQLLGSFTLLLVIATSVQALPDDRRKAINLSSDRATYENNRGIYTGHVEMNQGSLKIHADQLIIVESDRQVQKVVAYGKPAKFEQQAREDGGTVTASAQQIEYIIDQEEILLLKEANISHQGSHISGDRIVYSGRRQTVVADGGKDKADNRVKMTLQPQAAGEDDAPAAKESP